MIGEVNLRVVLAWLDELAQMRLYVALKAEDRHQARERLRVLRPHVPPATPVITLNYHMVLEKIAFEDGKLRVLVPDPAGDGSDFAARHRRFALSAPRP